MDGGTVGASLWTVASGVSSRGRLARVGDALDLVGRVAARQEGVITLRQAVRLGFDDARAARFVRAGRWQRLHRGVFVVHGGPVLWRTKALAAVAHGGPGAILSHESAAHLLGFTRDAPAILDLTIPASRYLEPVPGLRFTRSRLVAVPGPDPYVRLRGTSPARTVVDLVARSRDDDGAVAQLTAAVRAGASLEAIRTEVLGRPSVRRRALLLELLAEVDAGVESALELRYRRDVERRHALPTSLAQDRAVLGGMWVRADARYVGLGVRVELDGRLGHPGGRTARDTWRDNAVIIEARELTLRYRWQHVAGMPCDTAAQVAAALRSRGWSGTGRPCAAACPVGR